MEQNLSARFSVSQASIDRLFKEYDPESNVVDRASCIKTCLMQSEMIKSWKAMVEKDFARLSPTPSALASTEYSLEAEAVYNCIKKTEVIKPMKFLISDMHNSLNESIALSRKKNKLQSFLDDELDVAQNSSLAWRKHLCRQIIQRAAKNRKPFMWKDESGSTFYETKDPHDEQCKKTTAYDSGEFLRILQSIHSSNRHEQFANCWSTIDIDMAVPSKRQLQTAHIELFPTQGQIGLDDLFPQERQAYLDGKYELGITVVNNKSAVMARQYAKTGCNTSLRPAIWRQALGLQAIELEHRLYFAGLLEQSKAWRCVTDADYQAELQHARDHYDYFVFDELLETVVLAFSRDTYIQERVCNALDIWSDDDFAKQLPCSENSAAVLFNNIIPFDGFIMYLAPLTYIYADEIELYYIFREMYIRYWSRLHTISIEKGTALYLCKLFEDCVATTCPDVVLHLLSIGIAPIEIAFPWIHHGFSGFLEISEVLLLWDRMIGYDDMSILAILAASMFCLRGQQLKEAQDREAVQELFVEWIDVKAVPLLQHYLFQMNTQKIAKDELS